MFEAKAEAEAKALRPRPSPRPKFWPRGHFGLEDLTSLGITLSIIKTQAKKVRFESLYKFTYLL